MIMKRIKYLLMVAFVALMASCDDDYVEIDSLQVFGEEFFAGETVNRISARLPRCFPIIIGNVTGELCYSVRDIQ